MAQWQDINVSLPSLPHNRVDLDFTPVLSLYNQLDEPKVQENNEIGLIDKVALARQHGILARAADNWNPSSLPVDETGKLQGYNYPTIVASSSNYNQTPIGNVDKNNWNINNVWNFIKKYEGGYTNHDWASGGPTNLGVALRYNSKDIPDYDNNGLIDANDVKMLKEEDARRIFMNRYYNPSMANRLSPGVGLYYTDLNYMTGPKATGRIIRNSINQAGGNIAPKGLVDASVIEAMNNVDQLALLENMKNNRLNYYKTLPNWNMYGKGWTNRLNAGYNTALKLLQ